jgi:hypothetical protein
MKPGEEVYYLDGSCIYKSTIKGISVHAYVMQNGFHVPKPRVFKTKKKLCDYILNGPFKL